MEETTYITLNLTYPVSSLTFREVLRDQHLSSPDHSKVRLSDEQLRALIKVLFGYGMHYDEVSEKQRPLFQKSLIDNRHALLGISETFAEHLMNNLEAHSKKELDELQKMEWNLKDPLNNEVLMDFVEMELLDPTVSFRKWEYGRYAIDHICHEFFKTIDWDKERVSIWEENTPMEDYLEGLENRLQHAENDLDIHERELLQLVAKSRLWPQKTNLVDYLKAGGIVQSNLIGISLRMDKLKLSLTNTLKQNSTRKKNRGGPKL